MAAQARSFAASGAFEAQLADAVRGPDVDAQAAGVLSGYLTTLRRHLAAHKSVCAAAQAAQRRAEMKLSSVEERERASQKELVKLREDNRKLRWKTGAGGVTSKLLKASMHGKQKSLEDLATEAMAESESLRTQRDEGLQRISALERELKAQQQAIERAASMRSAQGDELAVLRETQKTLHRQVDETAMKSLRKAVSECQQTIRQLQQDKDSALADVRAAESAVQRKEKEHENATKDLAERVSVLEWELKRAQADKEDAQAQARIAERQAAAAAELSGESPVTAGNA